MFTLLKLLSLCLINKDLMILLELPWHRWLYFPSLNAAVAVLAQ